MGFCGSDAIGSRRTEIEDQVRNLTRCQRRTGGIELITFDLKRESSSSSGEKNTWESCGEVNNRHQSAWRSLA